MLRILHLISRVPRQLPLKGKPFTQHIMRWFFIYILFIGKASIEPRHDGGVFVIQEHLIRHSCVVTPSPTGEGLAKIKP